MEPSSQEKTRSQETKVLLDLKLQAGGPGRRRLMKSSLAALLLPVPSLFQNDAALPRDLLEPRLRALKQDGPGLNRVGVR
jgi:hypothetical protein